MIIKKGEDYIVKDEAINKIMEAEHGNHGADLASPIIEFVIEKCAVDEEFATLVMQEHKTLEKCLDFVMEQAKKHLNGKSGYIPPNEVFAMVNDYFTMDDAELEAKKAEEAAKREEKNKKRAEEKKAQDAEKQAQKKAEAKKKSNEKNQSKDQLTFFDI